MLEIIVSEMRFDVCGRPIEVVTYVKEEGQDVISGTIYIDSHQREPL